MSVLGRAEMKQFCRDGLRKAQVKLKLNLAKDVKKTRYVNQERKNKRGEYPDKQCWKTGNNKWTESPIFALLFKGSLSSHTSWVDGQQDGDWRSKIPAPESKDRVHDHEESECTEVCNEIHARSLQELPDVLTKPHFMIFENSWESAAYPGDWKKETFYPCLETLESRTMGISYLSASSLCLEGSGNRSSWKVC